jgi:hypothetical protein
VKVKGLNRKPKEQTLLYKLLHKKTGPISDELWLQAILTAQHDIRAYKQIAPTWKFDSWSRTRKMIYIVNVMSVYVRMICKFDLVKGDKGNGRSQEGTGGH